MAYFAKLDSNNVVIQVVKVNNKDIIDNNNIETWKQTSFNTKKGVHALGGTPFRKNYAGIGYTYDESRNAFIPPSSFKPFPSWKFSEESCWYEPPIEYPDDGKYYAWNEETTSWDEIA
jgi:hypothetical protein